MSEYWNQTTRPCDPDTPKTWPEWTDFLGQTYGAGDIVAVAVINGRSPQMVFARVLQINRRNSRGEEHIEIRYWWEDCDEDEPEARENTRYNMKTKSHDHVGWHVQREETKPGCTIKALPIADARGFWRSENPRAVTYQFWQNILKVDGTEFERREAASVADLTALAEELS